MMTRFHLAMRPLNWSYEVRRVSVLDCRLIEKPECTWHSSMYTCGCMQAQRRWAGCARHAHPVWCRCWHEGRWGIGWGGEGAREAYTLVSGMVVSYMAKTLHHVKVRTKAKTRMHTHAMVHTHTHGCTLGKQHGCVRASASASPSPPRAHLLRGPPVVQQTQRLEQEDAHVDGLAVGDTAQERHGVHEQLRVRMPQLRSVVQSTEWHGVRAQLRHCRSPPTPAAKGPAARESLPTSQGLQQEQRHTVSPADAGVHRVSSRSSSTQGLEQKQQHTA